MDNGDINLRPAADDSDAYVTFDARSVILDLPDDGRVAELLPGRAVSRPLDRQGRRPARLRES